MKAMTLLILIFTQTAKANEVELLHWWTSQGETAALEVLAKTVKQQGIGWKSAAVQGGGGDGAMAVLQARAIVGNPPFLTQIEGYTLKSWAELSFVTPLDKFAYSDGWGSKMHNIARQVSQYNGHYVSVPITLHRINWMWLNLHLFRQHALKVPQTWPQLLSVVQYFHSKGVKPLALGNTPWQVFMLFENMALGIGGDAYYRAAFTKLKPEALTSATTYKVLALFHSLGELIKEGLSKQNWDAATQELIEGRAAIQLSGDWVLGELITHEDSKKQNIVCYPAPQTERYFVYNIDSLALLDQSNIPPSPGLLVNTLAGLPFQQAFNRLKGALPARSDADLSGFHPCSVTALQAFLQAEKNGQLLPSVADSMALSPIAQNAIMNELFRYFNGLTPSAETLIARLLAIAENQRPK